MECNHICIIGLGSNTDREFSFSRAYKSLAATFPDIVYSSLMETEPVFFKHNTSLFYNQIALFTTTQSVDHVHSVLKQIEHAIGRREEHKLQEKILIDLDLIKFDDQVIKPQDFLRDYVRDGMNEVLKLRA